MPREGDWRGRQASGDQVGDQSGQANRINGFARCGQFSVGPPAVAAVVLALELIQPCRVYLVAGDSVEEEVIAEQPAGPALVRAAWGLSDRVQVGEHSGQPGLFAQFPCCGVSEFLAFLDATAGREPSAAGLDQQQPVRGIEQ
jgi:hypothetical protein